MIYVGLLTKILRKIRMSATLKIDITAIATINGVPTGIYSKRSGPGFVSSNGDIDFGAIAAPVDIKWTITAAGYKFNAAVGVGCETPVILQFDSSVTSDTGGGSDNTCTIKDKDDALSLKYTLNLLDSNADPVVLDPRVVNRGS